MIQSVVLGLTVCNMEGTTNHNVLTVYDVEVTGFLDGSRLRDDAACVVCRGDGCQQVELTSCREHLLNHLQM